MQAELAGTDSAAREAVGKARAYRAAVTPARVAAVIVLVGGLLRLYHVNALSLWIDEGMTVSFARLPWAAVIGLHGAYDVHPPLYYVLTKAVSLLAPEVIAGRLVSVAAGTVTLIVLYRLGARLIGPWAGVLATAALAVAPAHIWYSQEARQYALTALLVALSYLALAAYARSGERRWAATYGASLLLAMYTEYSAIFALAPQAVLLGVIWWRDRRRGVILTAAGALAAVLFLPWLPQLISVAGPTSQQTQFALSAGKVADAALTIAGLAGNGVYYWGGPLNPWDLWPGARPLFVLLMGTCALIGAFVLLRRSVPALITAAGLAAGTFVAATLVSLAYPSFAVRTVLYAVLGWSLLLAAASVAGCLPRAARIIGRVCFGIVLVLSLVTTSALYRGADKQHWNQLAADTASAATSGLPVATYPAVAGTLIGLYDPSAYAGRHLAIPDGGALPDLTGPGAPPGIWLAYVPAAGIQRPLAQLAGWGYRQVMHQYYWNPLYLDLYLRPGPLPGRPLPINGDFAGNGQVPAWRLSPQTSLTPIGLTAQQLTVAGGGEAATATAASPGVPYLLVVQARSHLLSGRVAVYLICTAGSGRMLSVAPTGAGASIPNDARWHTIEAATICPAGTSGLLVDLRDSGTGGVDVRHVGLRALAPAPR